MKLITKFGYFAVFSLIILFSSCVNDEVTSISLSKQDLDMKLGQSDSLNLEVSFTGDINKQPVTLSVGDSKIASVALGVSQDESKTTSTKFVKNIVIKALSTGSTTATIQVGSKTTKVNIKITQTSIIFNRIKAANYGPTLYDFYEINNNYYSIEISSGTAVYDAFQKKYSGTGKILVMSVLTPLSSDNLAQGDYYASNTADAYTFFPGWDDGTYFYPAFIIDVVNGARTFQLISDGAFSVSKNNDGSFAIVGDVNSDTDGIVHFSYNGDITPEDQRLKDQTLAFTSGNLNYYADLFYQSGLSNTYKLDLKSTSDSISLFINAPLTAKDSIPTGKYPFVTLPLNSTTQLKPYTLIPGYVDNDGTYLYSMGSWYWGADNIRLETGFADISRAGNNYRIEYELYNHFGVKFSGVYSGPLTYINKTTNSGVKEAAKVNGKSKGGLKKTIVNKPIGRQPISY